MSIEVERFIRIERRVGERWRIIPLGEKVRVWHTSTTATEAGDKRMHFHIAFQEGLARGQRVTYLGEAFNLVEISDSKRLVGLELSCAP